MIFHGCLNKMIQTVNNEPEKSSYLDSEVRAIRLISVWYGYRV